MPKKLRDGFNVWHMPGFRLTDQNLAARGVYLDRNANFESDVYDNHKAYQRWLAAMALIGPRRAPD